MTTALAPSDERPVAAAASSESSRRFVRDVALVGRFEMAEALRSRLLIVMVLLFVGAGGLGAYAFTELLGRVEANAAQVTGAPVAAKPGAMVRGLRNVHGYRDLLRTFLGSDEKADYFAAIPPIVVFFGWASFAFTPWLVLFTSAETIATEVASRSIRYSVLRTGRLEFALGKMLGQALILAGVTVLSALTFFGVAWASLAGFESGATALGLLSYLPRVFIYTLPFLGWAMLSSMLTSQRERGPHLVAGRRGGVGDPGRAGEASAALVAVGVGSGCGSRSGGIRHAVRS